MQILDLTDKVYLVFDNKKRQVAVVNKLNEEWLKNIVSQYQDAKIEEYCEN